MKEYYDDDPGYVPEDYDPHDTFVDYGQDTTPTDPFYADWSDDGVPGEKTMTPEQRERYYRARDDYYARKDEYYAARDRYYAQMERQQQLRERREWETQYYRESEDEDGEYDDPAKYEEPEKEPAGQKPEKEPSPRRRRRRKRRARRFITLLIAAALIALIAAGAPVSREEGRSRVAGRSNILLVGTDAEGYRTDTLMLLSMDRASDSLRLLSIPRDTYVPAYYASPKINSAYSVGGGGESGMEELCTRIHDVIGFAPDAYLMVNLDAFVRGVDALGGVDFTVPMDMDYDDPDQDLHIHLRAGEQHLDGMQAMGLVRFRSGYANADIGRTEVQREFIKSALRQWLRPSSLKAIPELLGIYREEVMTDLSVRNILWMAIRVLRADLGDIQTDVLPGYSTMVGDASCYVVDPLLAAPILENIDPYKD